MAGRKKTGKNPLIKLIVGCLKLLCLIGGIILGVIIWILWIAVPGLFYFIWSIWGYSKSEYKSVTHNSLFDVYFDKGKRGEYLIYRHLRGKVENARWLFNVYLPRENDRTTEIDVLMIHTSGIYVFESKNYSGWIFGSQDRDRWTQCIKPDERTRARKYHFLNPLIQNDIHLKYLKSLLPSDIHNYIYPIVVFGNQCELKKINVEQQTQPVVKRKNIKRIVNKRKKTNIISEVDVQEIYDLLYDYSQVDELIKNKHIEDIEKIKL